MESIINAMTHLVATLAAYAIEPLKLSWFLLLTTIVVHFTS
jgi:hypothetical protein